uniref:Uncharacterized protein n=1 Tax=Tetradesmus obliquus TaxID=3088 RepID=A0A383W638_TETOB|eukprot:jgi/Sobl393_1/15706/SZX73117.1
MARPSAATAVALLALLLIHGAASLPEAPKATADVVLGGAKKLLADAADASAGKRALLNDALTGPETRTARKLAGYWHHHKVWWWWHYKG